MTENCGRRPSNQMRDIAIAHAIGRFAEKYGNSTFTTKPHIICQNVSELRIEKKI